MLIQNDMRIIVALAVFCLAAASTCAENCSSCIISGSLVRDAAVSCVSDSALPQFDAVGLAESESIEISDFDTVSFCVGSSVGGNLNSCRTAMMIIIH